MFSPLVAKTGYLQSCRDGLDKPPPWTKKRVEQAFSKENNDKTQQKNPGNVQQIREDDAQHRTKPKQKPKPDNRLEQLNHLHRSTNVNDRLALTDGHRLKVEESAVSFSQYRAKGKPKPNFDLDFSQLPDKESAIQLAGSLDSDSELPDVSDILVATNTKTKRKTPSSTDYSDSEMDSLIGKIPLDDHVPDPIVSSLLPAKARSRSSSPDVELVTPPPRKRVKRCGPDTPPVHCKRPQAAGIKKSVAFSHACSPPFTQVCGSSCVSCR